jgi:hypothetical protein
MVVFTPFNNDAARSDRHFTTSQCPRQVNTQHGSGKCSYLTLCTHYCILRTYLLLRLQCRQISCDVDLQALVSCSDHITPLTAEERAEFDAFLESFYHDVRPEPALALFYTQDIHHVPQQVPQYVPTFAPILVQTPNNARPMKRNPKVAVPQDQKNAKYFARRAKNTESARKNRAMKKMLRVTTVDPMIILDKKHALLQEQVSLLLAEKQRLLSLFI